MRKPALSVYAGPAGDHNDRAMAAVHDLGAALADRLGLGYVTVGHPALADPAPWEVELARSRLTLALMAQRIDHVLEAGERPVTAITRCAVALATIPVVLRHHPDAVIVWFDAHADLNVPERTPTGYLGGMALSGPLGWWDSGLGSAPGASALLVGARDVDAPEQASIDAGRSRC